MCLNKETSWTTFFAGSIINLYVWKNTDDINLKLICILWQWVLLMQVFDALAWTSIEKSNDSLNRFAANGAMIANVTQPILVAMLFLTFGLNPGKNTQIFILALMAGYILWLLYNLNKHGGYNELVPGKNCGNLDYKWWKDFSYGATPYMILLFCSVLFLIKPYNLAVFQMCFIAFTLAVSMIFYSCGVASMWCWFAAFAPLATFLYLKYKQK